VSGSAIRYDLIRLMADGRFHSGQRLADELGVSRAAVWKQLQAIRENAGLQFDSVKGKGYRLASALELFSEERIREHLRPEQYGLLTQLHIHDSIHSTNTWLMEQAAAGGQPPSVCLAERQTAGKGRLGRTWVSPYGTNIYLSLHWRFDLVPAQMGGLSLACGVAVARALERAGIDGAALKWPNDVLWQRRKLGGLLLEVRAESSGPSDVVTGVGLNTHMPDVDGMAIDQPWVDLSTIQGKDFSGRNRLVALLIDELLIAMGVFAEQGLEAFIEAWRTYDHFRGERVTLRMGETPVQGDYLGIDGTGAIRLRVDGVVRTFQAGEVSLTRSVANQ
jgi:BirA family biotin operon repressor/biotin-[acetyl-CoA-carboxylase] ligase